MSICFLHSLTIPLLVVVSRAGLRRFGTLQRGAPIVVLCKTCNVLLCVLAQPIVDNSGAGPLKRGVQLGAIGPIGLRPALVVIVPIRNKGIV
jgi:hypothetical protein